MKVYLSALFLIFVSAISCPNPAFAKAKKSIKIGVEETELFPYSIVESKVYKGFFHDLIAAFSKKSDYEVEFIALPAKRLMKSYINGEVDVKLPDNPQWSPELKEKLQITYSSGLIKYTDGTLVAKEAPKEDIKNLGTFLGYSVDAYKDQIKGEAIRLNEDPELQSLLEKLKYGFVDALYLNVKATNFAIKHNEWPYEIQWNKKMPFYEGTYQLSSFTHPEFVKSFNAFLSKEQALIKKLKKQYALD